MNNRNHGRGTGSERMGSGKDRDTRGGGISPQGRGVRKGGRAEAGYSHKGPKAQDIPPEGFTGEAALDESSTEDGEQWIAGKHPVLEALKSGHALNKIWLAEHLQRTHVTAILEEAKARGVVVQYADKRKLDQMVPGTPHQGVVAQAAAATYVEVEEILARAAALGEAPLLVLLDEVEDPHNLGSVLRTADCTGVHGVIVPKRRSASLSAVVAKTSAGAVEYVPVARVSNMVQTIGKLKDAGVWVAGAAGEAQTDVYRANLTGPLAIVIGNEGRGLSRLVRENCDFLISLPMKGRINSLNASVAAGVILYEATRQRQAGETTASGVKPEQGGIGSDIAEGGPDSGTSDAQGGGHAPA